MDALTDLILIVCGLAICVVALAHLHPALLPLLGRMTLVGPAARLVGALLLAGALALVGAALVVDHPRPLIFAGVCAWGGAMGLGQGRIAFLGETPRQGSPGTGLVLLTVGLASIGLGVASLHGG